MRRKIYVVATILMVCLSPTITFAAGEAMYQRGLQSYASKNFRLAAEQFQASVSQGNQTPSALLYLGYAYSSYGDPRALTAYCTLVDNFPSSNEAKLAAQQIKRLDPNVTRTCAALSKRSAASAPSVAAVAASSATSSRSASSPRASSKDELIARLVITEPKFGHSRVRPQTVEIVKTAIKRLDPRFSKILAEGGATITISPNTLDRWPNGGGDTMTLPNSETLVAEAGGQTYHRDRMGPDINLFERPILRNTKELKEPFSDEELLRTSFHEMGHGVDDLQKLSANSKFIELQAQDTNNLSSSDKTQYNYYTVPMETCAEITGGLIGHNEAASETANVIRCFPLSAAWLKQQLKF
jgi:hypothetical protein